MTLTIATARITYRGADRLDITRKTGDHLGIHFAPSRAILEPAMAARRHAASLRAMYPADGLFSAQYVRACGDADKIELAAWLIYEPAYLAECERMPWRMLRDVGRRVVGVCYCTPIAGAPLRCHRVLWAREAVRRLGATYEGETR